MRNEPITAALAQHIRAVPMSRIRDCGPHNIRGSSLLMRRAFAGLLMASTSGISPALAQSTGAAIAVHGTASAAAPCVACHGAHGEGNAANGFPRLAGLPAPYIRAQLSAYAEGRRENPVMAPIARVLSADEAQAVSLYYAGLPAPDLPNSAPMSAGPGALLALDGRWSAKLPPCVACHGPDGSGVGTSFPPLAGQPAHYLEAQLEAWQQGKRPPGPLGLMQAVARRLSPSDIAAVSRWFAAQPGGGGR
jgi:thiosulfate dehydrogenase